MWIKICANTNLEDALAAAELGADALGFVFAPSKREVTAAQVAPICAALPAGIERVGVFGAGSVEEIASTAERAGLTAVQLHRSLDLHFADRLGDRLGTGFSIIQTLHWDVAQRAESASQVSEQMALLARETNRKANHNANCRVLVDARVGSAPSGGTGQTFDWEAARPVLTGQPGLKLIAAGGLRPDNVVEAIRVLRPWGVDVASGVELVARRKDFTKLRMFIENARGAS